MRYWKYHGLGNDYLVMDPAEMGGEPDREVIRLICHRNYGIGSDGILLGPLESESCDFGVRIFNPDGSEAEKSGNGLRIFARYLLDERFVSNRNFTVETPSGAVSCEVSPDDRNVTVEMGRVSFESTDIPVQGAPREVLNEKLEINGTVLIYCAASVGNPHCVVFSKEPTPEQARRFGPMIETHPRFPKRTNVQFMKVVDRGNIRIEIWERGAGYTLASGSSSTAAAAVAHRMGLCDSDVAVHMPGGCLRVELEKGFFAALTGPVTKVCEGVMTDEMFGREEWNRAMEKPALEILKEEFSIHRFPPDEPVPSSVLESSIFWVGRTDEELSVVCESSVVLDGGEENDGWSCMKVRGPIDLSASGVLAGISAALASAQINIFALSTFDTDYILVKSSKLEEALDALDFAGYEVKKP
jgi:diaminopimelate epimerase